MRLEVDQVWISWQVCQVSWKKDCALHSPWLNMNPTTQTCATRPWKYLSNEPYHNPWSGLGAEKVTTEVWLFSEQRGFGVDDVEIDLETFFANPPWFLHQKIEKISVTLPVWFWDIWSQAEKKSNPDKFDKEVLLAWVGNFHQALTMINYEPHKSNLRYKSLKRPFQWTIPQALHWSGCWENHHWSFWTITNWYFLIHFW